MRIIKHIAAACAAIMLLSSCSVLKSVTANALSTGTNTGSALSSIFNVLKSAGSIDLGNLTNILNIGKILTGANSLTGATPSYTDSFTQGLINGSSNLVNTGNASQVLNGLKALTNIDTSAFTKAAASSATGAASEISTSDQNVASTMSALTSLLGLLK